MITRTRTVFLGGNEFDYNFFIISLTQKKHLSNIIPLGHTKLKVCLAHQPIFILAKIK